VRPSNALPTADFAEELSEPDADAEAILETVRDIEGTLGGLDRGDIKFQ